MNEENVSFGKRYVLLEKKKTPTVIFRIIIVTRAILSVTSRGQATGCIACVQHTRELVHVHKLTFLFSSVMHIGTLEMHT